MEEMKIGQYFVRLKHVFKPLTIDIPILDCSSLDEAKRRYLSAAVIRRPPDVSAPTLWQMTEEGEKEIFVDPS